MSPQILCRFRKVGYSVRVMKFFGFCAIFGAVVLVGCSRQEEASRPMAEIKGKAINSAAKTNAAIVETPKVAVASAEPAKTENISTTNAPALVNGYLQVGFDKLSAFHYIMPDEASATNQPPADQFPRAIKALDQKPIALRGFMLPLKVDQGLVTEMLIMKDQSMCCFGTSPKINEWVSVKMSEKGVKPIMDQPVTLFGKLKVGEMRENGYLVGIYEMMGDKMEWE
jgi:hypothetical protein